MRSDVLRNGSCRYFIPQIVSFVKPRLFSQTEISSLFRFRRDLSFQLSDCFIMKNFLEFILIFHITKEGRGGSPVHGHVAILPSVFQFLRNSLHILLCNFPHPISSWPNPFPNFLFRFHFESVGNQQFE